MSKVWFRNKKKIILLNKCDLSDELVTKKWQSYFKTQGIETVLINANDGKGMKQVIDTINNVMKEEVEKERERGRINKTIRAAVLGIPNVRKIFFYK